MAQLHHSTGHRGFFRRGRIAARYKLLPLFFIAGLGLAQFPSAGAAAPSSFAPVADATVFASSPGSNYGTLTYLRPDGSPVRVAYLRFDVQNVSAPVSRATLRLYAQQSEKEGFEVHPVADSSWGETSITYANAPTVSPTILSRSGPLTGGRWYDLDVTSAVAGNGLVNFALTTSYGHSMYLSSREAGAAQAPQLVVESSDGSSSSSSSLTTTTASTTTTSSSTPLAPVPNPVSCAGYPEKRVFLEGQGWWMQTPGKTGTEFGHVHSGTCFPWGQRISGVVHFDVRITMFMNPGLLTNLRIQIFHSGAPDPVKNVQLNKRCADMVCAFWVPVDIDTRLAYDGCQEFRFQSWVTEPDGNKLVATTGFRTYLANGRPVSSYCASDGRGVNNTEGRGWYTNFGYEIGRIDDVLPMDPVHGLWQPKVKLSAGSGGIAPTWHMVCIDPAFHAGSKGLVLFEGPASWGPSRLWIDTTKLANGPHRLVLRTDAATSNGSTLSGLLVVPFRVAN